MTPEQMQQVLGSHIAEQLTKIEQADAAARATADANAKKVNVAIEAALAKALMGAGEAKAQNAVKFPDEVFDLAVALTKQPALIAPMLAFYRTLQRRINSAVADVLKDMMPDDVDQGAAGATPTN